MPVPAGALSALVVLIALCLGSGCAAVDIDSVYCSITGDLPHESSGTPGFIVSKGRVRCVGKGTVSSVTASVKIQIKARGRWIDLSQTVRSETLSSVKLNTRYTIQNRSLRCRPGVFRTGVAISAKINGKARQLTKGGWRYSDEKVNPCA